ncbi:MAG: response regulator [Bacteroidota bacterium]
MEKKLKILLLEDSDDDAGLLEYQLRKEKIPFQLLRIDTREELIDALDNFMPDIILSDHSLPQFNSLEALHICRDRNQDIPFILLTGAAAPSFIAECIREGADDCILKSELSKVPDAIKTRISQAQESIALTFHLFVCHFLPEACPKLPWKPDGCAKKHENNRD